MTRSAAVVLDLDGTLVDSERDGHRVVFNVAFKAAALPDRWDVSTCGNLPPTAAGVRVQVATTGGKRGGYRPFEARSCAQGVIIAVRRKRWDEVAPHTDLLLGL